MTWALWLAVSLGSVAIAAPLLVTAACVWIIVIQWMRGTV